MRTIKFRGICIKSKQLVYGNLVINYPTQTYRIVKDFALVREADLTECSGGFYIINYKTLGEYTGLKDKNGKDIYENDIIEFKGERFKINYKQDAFFVGYIATKDDTNSSYIHIWYDNIEVIGNIHENPELLK